MHEVEWKKERGSLAKAHSFWLLDRPLSKGSRLFTPNVGDHGSVPI
jgi:hypothetical protein